MFESVVPETAAPRKRIVLYESLPVSIGLHAIALAGVVAASLWQVTFPKFSPKMTAMYQVIADLPTPPPPPPPPAAPAKAQPVALQPQAEVPLDEIVAPTVIPDEIPILKQLPLIEEAKGVEGGIEGGMEGGVVGGAVGGVEGGEFGGELGGVVGSIANVPPNTVVVERDKPLPMVTLSKVYPQYPEEGRQRGWEDEVILRYIIGTNGRVREVIVLTPPQRKMFADSAVKAIRNWRFRPLIKDGQAQEVIHELTVLFRLES